MAKKATYKPAAPKPKATTMAAPKRVTITSRGVSGGGGQPALTNMINAYVTPGSPGPYGAAGAAARANAGTPDPPTQPLDPNAVNAQITAQRNIGVADLYATWQQGNLDQNFGYGAGGAANPYSQAALLQDHYKRQQQGTLNSAASSGNLYAGSYGRQTNEDSRQYAIGDDQLRRQYNQQSGQNQFDRLRTYADNSAGVDQAKYDALLKAIQGG